MISLFPILLFLADHVLINNGIPGAKFIDFARGICLEHLLPKQPDLVILEHLPYITGGDSPAKNQLALEQLINRLQYNFNLTSFPPMIFLNMHRVAQADNYTMVHGKDARENAEKCIRDVSLCPSLCPDNFVGLPSVGSNSTTGEMVTNHVAAHYGAASLSYSNLLMALIQSPARGDLSECQFFAHLFGDMLHPSGPGKMLLSDLLLSYIVGAREHFQKHAAAEGSSTRTHQSIITPLNPKSVKVPWMQCFGSLQHEIYGGDEMASHGLNSTKDINVVKAEGWTYVETDGGKAKPGWVSTVPGSVLWMAVNTTFGKMDDDHFINLFLLSSYEHMGQAEVTCVSGCRCEASKIDGHAPRHKHSVPMQHEFRLSGLEDGGNDSIVDRPLCVIQLKVLPESNSGEHKVKVIQLAIKVIINAAASLPHASDEG